MRMARRLAGAAAAIGAMVASGAAFAAAEPWGVYLQPAASTIAEKIHTFSALTFWIITPITLLVLGLLVAVMVKFNAKANPVPSRTTHNTLIEVLWTVVPVVILLVIAVPSFRLLYAQQVIPEAAVTVKATGNQWYWDYEYPGRRRLLLRQQHDSRGGRHRSGHAAAPARRRQPAGRSGRARSSASW